MRKVILMKLYLKGQVETTPFALYTLFVERVRKNLHIAFTMTPIGENFRKYMRMFPSLVNCCTIDWFAMKTSLLLLS